MQALFGICNILNVFLTFSKPNVNSPTNKFVLILLHYAPAYAIVYFNLQIIPLFQLSIYMKILVNSFFLNPPKAKNPEILLFQIFKYFFAIRMN